MLIKLVDCADERIIARGYDYYMSDQVLDVEQTDTYKYRGFVSGNAEMPYSVQIDIKNPHESHCNCPYAAKGEICKHMVALYFAAFPEDAEGYEGYLEEFWEEDAEIDYCDQYDYNDYNNWENRNNAAYLENSKMTRSSNQSFGIGLNTVYYDELLHEYIDSLSINELKSVVEAELKKDRAATFSSYLEPRYKDFIHKMGDKSEFIDALNSRLIALSRAYDYEWIDYSQPILRNEEKNIITEIWNNKNYCEKLNILFTNELLAVYDDYIWIAKELRSHLSDDDRFAFGLQLRKQLDYLKKSGIKSTSPKSNLLIAICIIEDLSVTEIAELMIKNSKYHEFIKYIISNTKNLQELYATVARKILEKPLYNKQNIPFMLNEFYIALKDRDILHEYYLYSFLNNCDVMMLEHMKKDACLGSFVPRIEKMTKNLSQLVILYKYTGLVDKLFELLMSKGSTEELIRNTEVLRDKYELELKDYYTAGFYKALTGEKNRKIYHEASQYIRGLIKLKNGNLYLNNIIAELNESQYAKCYALFEEITIAAGREVARHH